MLPPRAIEETRQLCERDPRAAAIRDVLLDLERCAHATGWDGPDAAPRLFQLDLHLTEPRLHQMWCEEYTAVILAMMEANGGRGGSAIEVLAHANEELTEALRAGRVPREAVLPPDLQQAHKRLVEAFANGQDLADTVDNDPRYRFHGYGLRVEGWMASGRDASARRFHNEHRLDEYEGRQEVRLVYFLGRDGSFWAVYRRRSHRPAIIRQSGPDDSWGGHQGLIVHGLSRMVNAVVPEDVPIWPDGPKPASAFGRG